jgi:hypothetical protein
MVIICWHNMLKYKQIHPMKKEYLPKADGHGMEE